MIISLATYPDILANDERFEAAEKECCRRLSIVKGKYEGMRAKMQSMQRAVYLMQGLRCGMIAPPNTPWSDPTQLHWLFVEQLEIKLVGKHLRLDELECLVVPEVLQPQVRHELPPGKTHGRCEDVTHSPDELAQEIASSLTCVEIGSWPDVLSVPCDECGHDCAVICERAYNHDGSGPNRIIAGVLCVECPSFIMLVQHPLKTDTPFLAHR